MSYPNTEPTRWTVYRITHDVAADTAERAIELTTMTPLTEIRAFNAEVLIDATATAEALIEVRAEYEACEIALAHSRWRYQQMLRWLTGTHARCSATNPLGGYQCIFANGHTEQADARGIVRRDHSDGSVVW